MKGIWILAASLFYMFLNYGFLSQTGMAQNYGNEWINYSKTYYRFSIPATGMYRITQQQLQQAGVPVNSYNPQNIQLFFKGKEIPCYIEGENSGVLEYIEFYAEKNNGWFDAEMFDNLSHQTNPNYSLINDTAAVFITWNNLYSNMRMVFSAEQDFTGFTPAPYGYVNVLEQYTGKYFEMLIDCEYTEAEGWFDATSLTIGNTLTKSLATPAHSMEGDSIKISLAFATYSANSHHVHVSGPGFELDTIFYNYTSIKKDYSIVNQSLNSTSSFVFSSINDVSAPTDNSVISFISVTYPRTFANITENPFFFTLPGSPDTKTYLEFTGLGSGTYYLYDVTNGYRMTTLYDQGVLKVLVPELSDKAEMVLVSSTGFLSASQISSSSMVNHSSKNKPHIILTHPSLWDEAQEYATYRGSYLVDAETLYDQFGYGIRKHPLALRNFIKYVYNQWGTKPEFIFIIGKGINNVSTRNDATIFASNLVPTMGYTSSDELLGTRIDGSSLVSAIPMGRLSARTGSDVSNYLQKVKAFELNTPDEWMKHIIHFGGGENADEQTQFKKYLKQYESIIEDTLFGGYVSTFLKTSSDPITITKSDSITRLINNGVSLMTFYGHASYYGFDQNIDQPDAYDNQSKYPLMLANSCYSGDIFMYGRNNTSEEWVLAKDKGAIGFLAMVYQGYITYLNLFSNQFYKHLSSFSYGEPLGKIIHNAKTDMAANPISDHTFRSTIHSFTLHGDPALVLNSFQKPDIRLEPSQVFFSPATITTQVDSFSIFLAPVNMGRSTNESFVLHVQRTFQDGTNTEYQTSVEGLLFKDTVSIRLPVDLKKGVGLNQFIITADALNQVDEVNESNNVATLQLYISSSGLIPTIPYEYGIHASSVPVLKASTGNLLNESQTSIFQLDTSFQFNSPNLVTDEITHTGGIIEWQPSVAWQTQTPYFWRAAKKSDSKEVSWTTSSFLIEPDKTGWGQKQFGQMLENSFKFIEPDTLTQAFGFSISPKSVRCHNRGILNNNTYYYVGYSVDGTGEYSSCGANSALIVVIIDSTDLTVWQSNHGNYGQVDYPKCPYSSRVNPDKFMVFHLSSTQTLLDATLDNIVSLIDNEVPDGFYFLIYSFNGGLFQLWRERHYQAFNSWGASNDIRFLQNYQPYIFFSKKGDPSLAEEVYGNYEDDIDLNTSIVKNFNYGYITSGLIGPSKQWQSFQWSATNLENNPNEISYVQIFGIDPSGNSTLLIDSITGSTRDLLSVNAGQYPYMQLKFFTRDREYETPTRLDGWKVYFTPVTDLAINPQKGWDFKSDTLQEGQSAQLEVGIENIGLVNADSLLITYWFTDAHNKEHALVQHRLKNLAAGESVTDTLSFGTLSYEGSNQLWMEINPVVESSATYDQIEQYHFNNIIQKTFFVKPDESNPLLDVTFDGIHIMDGDLVSAKPEIVIQLTDENPYIALSDTSLFSIYIKSQQTGIEQKLVLSETEGMVFEPAQLPENQARIIYSASFPDDGIYELRVQAKDATGNESGTYDYQISFQVINESTITNVFNYPNPFSTATRFVFELSGSEIPDLLRIEILTVTGRVVKVIEMDELGPINLGKNISQYVWDGTDEFGDRLAIGVYFYRVFARLNGQELKVRDTGTGQYFKNGFGKMYLIR